VRAWAKYFCVKEKEIKCQARPGKLKKKKPQSGMRIDSRTPKTSYFRRGAAHSPVEGFRNFGLSKVPVHSLASGRFPFTDTEKPKVSKWWRGTRVRQKFQIPRPSPLLSSCMTTIDDAQQSSSNPTTGFPTRSCSPECAHSSSTQWLFCLNVCLLYL